MVHSFAQQVAEEVAGAALRYSNMSQEQRAVLAWVVEGSGSLVVEAVAGAGKTTTIVEAIRVMTGSVFLGAYNKKMGDELQRRVADIPWAVAGTFHSVGFGALRRASRVRLEVDEKKVRKIVDGVVAGTEYVGWETSACALVSLAKQSGFGVRYICEKPRRADWMRLVSHYDLADRLPEDANPNRLIDIACRALEISSEDRAVIDFDDMLYMPLLLGLRLEKKNWVVVDEAQDTNEVRLALVRAMLAPGGRVVAVGDPHQAIFGFTGADSDSLDRIRRKFSASTLRLGVTFRCPKSVVEVAREYVGHITAAPTAPDGEHLDMTYEEMVALCAAGDAVLCRHNAQLVDLCFALIRAGKPAKMEGRAIGEGLAALAGRWKVKSLDVLVTKLERHLERELEKAAAKEDEARAERAEDQHRTMICLVDRGRETGISTVGGLQEMIRAMFDDVGASPRLVVLSSVHRSKGLEWPRVFVLGRRELMPSKRAQQDWQRAQEVNLCYVAVTRAQRTLVDVALKMEG